MQARTPSPKPSAMPQYPSMGIQMVRWGALILGGLTLSTAYPPLNWSVLAFIGITPLIVLCINASSARKAALYGFVWSIAWMLPSFWWLREIEFFIPFAIAPILSITSAIWAATLRWFYLSSCVPQRVRLEGFRAEDEFFRQQPFRELFFIAGAAAFWCVLDALKLWVFPWNFLYVTQWRNLALLQISQYTGAVALTFLIVATNLAFALALRNTLRAYRINGKSSRPWPVFVMLIILVGVSVWGYFPIMQAANDSSGSYIRFGVVQGDISQRRKANQEEATEALDVYLNLSHQLIAAQEEIPQIMIWPETAVPYPFRGMYGAVTDRFRREISTMCRRYKMPLLLGTLDPLDPYAKEYEFTNSALLIGANGAMDTSTRLKYDKIYRVPFGEFVPGADLLPTWYRQMANMGRDLVPGTDASPVEILPGIRAGMSICYESIFSSLARREAKLGANMLLTISNDAWYPASSEPEQHLANAVARTVETGLPALRVGNNGGTLAINRCGAITEQLMPVKMRGRKAGILNVLVPDKPKMTFFVRYGELFYWFLGLLALSLIIHSSIASGRIRKTMLKTFEPNGEKS